MEKIPNLVIVLNLLFSRYHFVFSCSSLRALCIGSFSYFFAWGGGRGRGNMAWRGMRGGDG